MPIAAAASDMSRHRLCSVFLKVSYFIILKVSYFIKETKLLACKIHLLIGYGMFCMHGPCDRGHLVKRSSKLLVDATIV